jgi:hypothetical protein
LLCDFQQAKKPGYSGGDTATVATTDATETTLYEFDTKDDTCYHVEATVVATETDAHDEMASYQIKGTFRVDGAANAVQVGTTSTNHFAEDTAGWNCDFDTSGTTIRVRVTGAAATNITWRGKLTWMEVS